MAKIIDSILGSIEGKPFKVKVVCRIIEGENRFILEYKRTRFSRWRILENKEGKPVSYETYMEAAAGAYIASITSLKFYN